MNKLILLATAGAAVFLGGCDLLKPGTAVDSVNATLKAESANVQALQNDLLETNRTLRAISRSSYECGDPKQKASRTLDLAVSGPRAALHTSDKDRKTAADAALDVLNAYQQTMAAIYAKAQNQQKTDDSVFDGATTAVNALGGAVPVAAPFTAAAAAAITVMRTAIKDVNIALTNKRMSDYAKGMQDVLRSAVDTLKQNYQSFSSTEVIAFKAWDDCSREAFYYVRDVATVGIPLDSTKPMSATNRMPIYVAPSTGVELSTLWQGYRTKRADYRGKMLKQKEYEQQLESVVAQNDALAKGQKLDLSTATNTIADLANKAKAACKAYEGALGETVPNACK